MEVLPVRRRFTTSTAPISMILWLHSAHQSGSYRWFRYRERSGCNCSAHSGHLCQTCRFTVRLITGSLPEMLKQVEIFTDGSFWVILDLGVTALFYAIADARNL